MCNRGLSTLLLPGSVSRGQASTGEPSLCRGSPPGRQAHAISPKEPLRISKRIPVQTPGFCCCSLSCSVKPTCFRTYRQVSFQGKLDSFLLVYTNLLSYEVHSCIHFLFLHTPYNFDLGSLCSAQPLLTLFRAQGDR